LLTCKEFLGWLNDYLDDTGGEDVRRQVQQHIGNCPNCWVVYDTTKKTLEIYKGMDAQPVPEPLRAKLIDAIQKRTAARDH
jgi:predicted anti-sigma-YlaC factor YlaD